MLPTTTVSLLIVVTLAKLSKPDPGFIEYSLLLSDGHTKRP